MPVRKKKEIIAMAQSPIFRAVGNTSAKLQLIITKYIQRSI